MLRGQGPNRRSPPKSRAWPCPAGICASPAHHRRSHARRQRTRRPRTRRRAAKREAPADPSPPPATPAPSLPPRRSGAGRRVFGATTARVGGPGAPTQVLPGAPRRIARCEHAADMRACAHRGLVLCHLGLPSCELGLSLLEGAEALPLLALRGRCRDPGAEAKRGMRGKPLSHSLFLPRASPHVLSCLMTCMRLNSTNSRMAHDSGVERLWILCVCVCGREWT